MTPTGWFDLTMPVSEGMCNYPGDPLVERQVVADYDFAGYRLTKWCLGSHTGTHVDAPSHFWPNGAHVQSIAADTLIGIASVVDLRCKGPGEEITADDIAAALPCERLLICTGWDRYQGGPDCFHYFHQMPGLTADAADMLVRNGVRLLGIDAPNVHAVNWAQIHHVLLGAQVVLVEGLTGLAPLVGRRIELIVAPLLLMGADGAPARVFARVVE